MTLAWLDASSTFVDDDAAVAAIVIVEDDASGLADMLSELRREAATARLRTLVVDRRDSSRVAAVMSEHPDVTLLRLAHRSTSHVIGAGIEWAGTAESILFVSPAVSLDRGVVGRLLSRLRSEVDIAAVAPLVRTPDGDVHPTLRREPAVLGAFGDRLLDTVWHRRPAALRERILDPRAYGWPHPARVVDTEILLASASAVAAVGIPDDRFGTHGVLLDMQRRLRDAGRTVWFDPAGGATRRTGAAALDSAAADRALYIEMHRPRAASAYRAASGVRRVAALGRRTGAQPAIVRSAELPSATVIIPAHDEAAVIARTLDPLAAEAARGVLEVIVVCNGCRDDTADRARAYPGVSVVETDEASKVAALNLGDAHATRWPRVYLDADIQVSTEALAPVLGALADGAALAGRPSFAVDVTHATLLVRAYQRARARMPSMSGALWGAGVYALSRDGHERLGTFPEVIADDLYVDRLFTVDEKVFPDTPPVRVRSPRTGDALLSVLTRARRGPAQQGVDSGASSVRELARTVRGPRSAFDAIVFAAFAVAARRRARRATATRWERDDSTRASAEQAGKG